MEHTVLFYYFVWISFPKDKTVKVKQEANIRGGLRQTKISGENVDVVENIYKVYNNETFLTNTRLKNIIHIFKPKL